MTDQKTIHELIEIVGMKMRELEYSEKTLVSYEKVWKSFNTDFHAPPNRHLNHNQGVHVILRGQLFNQGTQIG